MSDEQNLLLEAAAEVFREQSTPQVVTAAEAAGWAPALWSVLEDTGFSLLGVPESAGGSGGSLHDAAQVLRIAARYSAPVPLGETALLAGWLLALAGQTCPRGPLTAAIVRDGTAQHVPYGRIASGIVVLAQASDSLGVGLATPTQYVVRPGTNMAGIPTDDVEFSRWEDISLTRVPLAVPAVILRGALMRSIQIWGAAERVLELSLAYASVRRQFGVPIGRFQAVQHLLASMAGEVAATGATVEAALLAPTPDRVAAAKAEASQAAGKVAALGHQVHGAIGFTHEHQLHHLTRRLWAWRDEFGTEAVHGRALGASIGQRGAAHVWDFITDEGREHGRS